MSVYINFFLRYEDNFIPLLDCGRSSYIYQFFAHKIPYEKIKPLTISDLRNSYYELRDMKDEFKESLNKYDKTIKEIPNFNNSVDDKLAALNEIEETYDEIKETINEIEVCMIKIDFLISIIEAMKYYDERPDLKVDINKYLYAGIEICSPTVEDIEEK